MKIPLFKPYFSPSSQQNITNAVGEILQSGRLMMGPYKNNFEKLFAEKIGVPYATSVNSCTTALTICLKFFGVEGYDVLVPSGSFITSISSIMFAGGNPILVDMNPETLSFDLEDLKRKLTPKTKGIVWVHLSGAISEEYEQLLSFAKEKSLFVIEDAAHALGSSIDGKMAGSLADASCFSFFPTKIISSGTGGMIATKNEELKDYAECLRMFGKSGKTGQVEEIGNDWFLDEFRSSIGYYQLKELDENLKCRRKTAAYYQEKLSEFEQLKLRETNLPSYYQFSLFMKNQEQRDRVVKTLKENYEIQVRGIYLPCHMEKIFLHLDNNDLKKTEDTLLRSLCLPVFNSITEEEMDYVISAIKKEAN